MLLVIVSDTAEEQNDLEEAAKTLMCDSTSDDSDGTLLDGDGESSEDDRRYMEEAKSMAMNSPDEQTKVSIPISHMIWRSEQIVSRVSQPISHMILRSKQSDFHDQ